MTCHVFNIEDAKKYGVDSAIILHNIRFWLDHNKANGTHINDGYVWTYNSARAFSDLFPYWSSNKIQKLLKKLESDGVIITGNYNRIGYDKTKWYTLPEYKIESSPTNPSAKWLNGSSQNDEPIPDINTDIIKNNTGISGKQKMSIEDISNEFPSCRKAIGLLRELNGVYGQIYTNGLYMDEWEMCESVINSIDEFDYEYFNWWMKTRSKSMRKTPSLPNMLKDKRGVEFDEFYEKVFMQERED